MSHAAQYWEEFGVVYRIPPLQHYHPFPLISMQPLNIHTHTQIHRQSGRIKPWGHTERSLCLSAAVVTDDGYVPWPMSVPSNILNLSSRVSFRSAIIALLYYISGSQMHQKPMSKRIQVSEIHLPWKFRMSK